MKQQVDTILIHGYVITVDETRRILKDGAIAIRDGKIVEVNQTDQVLAQYQGEIYDCKGGVVHPGLVDAHEHLCLHICRGWEPDTFSVPDTWVNFESLVYPAAREPEEEASVEIATIEWLKNGVTMFSDTGSAFFPELSIEAANRSGIRGILGRIGGDTFQDELAFLDVPKDQMLAQMEHCLQKYADCRVHAGAQLCGMGDCTDALVQEAKAVARKYDQVLFMHQCAYPHEVEMYRQKYGVAPVRHLQNLGVLDDHTALVHMACLEEGDVELLKETGTNIVHCPGASMKFGLGAFSAGRFPEMQAAGINIALGTDSGTWCDSLDILQQVYLAAVGHREARRDRTAINSYTAFEMATINGAKALGKGDILGSLEAGKLADIVIHRTDLPECRPAVDPFINLVFSARSKSVDTVLIDGEFVLLHGKVTTMDEEAVYENAERISFDFKKQVGFEVYSKWPIL